MLGWEWFLNNYDAEDSYGQTEYEGMEWGLDGVQLSHQHRAYFTEGTFSEIMNWLLENVSVKPYYDFYLSRDTDHSSATIRDRSGYTFCNEIIESAPSTFAPISLASNPDSAIEYCYNKNKRNADGSVASVEWYLPAIDEVEEIMMSKYGNGANTYGRFIDFQGKYYWSSQPAFLRGMGHYYSFSMTEHYADYYIDDLTSARSTKVTYNSTTAKYEIVSSGVDGYQQLMDIYKPGNDWGNEPIIVPVKTEPFTYTTEHTYDWGIFGTQTKTFTVTIDKMTSKTNHSGNSLHTKQSRVRCVRRNAAE